MDLEPEPRVPASPGVAAQNQSRRRSSALLSTAILEDSSTIDFDVMLEPTPQRRCSFSADTASPLEEQLPSAYELSPNLERLQPAPPNAEQIQSARPSLEATNELRRHAAAVKVQAVYRGKEGRELAAIRAHVRAGEEYDAAIVAKAPVVKPPPPPPRTPSSSRAPSSPGDRELSEDEEDEWDQIFGIWYLPRRRTVPKSHAMVETTHTREGGVTTHRKGTWKLGKRSRRNACGAVAECWSSSVGAARHLATRITGLGLLGLLLLLLVSTLDAIVGVFLAPAAALPTATLLLDESGRSSRASHSAWILG